MLKTLFTLSFWRESSIYGLRAGFEVLKWMLPAVIIARLLQFWGLDLYLNKLFMPLMGLMGLPEWTSLVWVTAILANLYAALAVLAASYINESLTIAQMSILCTLMLIAHSLPVEGRIAQALRVRLGFILFIRLATALVIGIILNLFYRAFDLLQQPINFFWQTNFTQPEGLISLLLAELQSLSFLFFIVVGLVIVMELLKEIRVVYYCELLLQPVLRLLGISGKLAHIVAVGCLLGLTYGSGLLIAEAKKHRAYDLAGATIFISMCHALIEDTLLMVLIGADLSAVLFARLLVCSLVVGLLMRSGAFFYLFIHKVSDKPNSR